MKIVPVLLVFAATAAAETRTKTLDKDMFMPIRNMTKEEKEALDKAVLKCQLGPLKDKDSDKQKLDEYKLKIEDPNNDDLTKSDATVIANLFLSCLNETEIDSEMEPLRDAGNRAFRRIGRGAIFSTGWFNNDNIPNLTEDSVQSILRRPRRDPEKGLNRSSTSQLLELDKGDRALALLALHLEPSKAFVMGNNVRETIARKKDGTSLKGEVLELDDNYRFVFSGSLEIKTGGVSVSLVATEASEVEADEICGVILSVDMFTPSKMELVEVDNLPLDDPIMICFDPIDNCPIDEKQPMTIKDGKFVKAEGVVMTYNETMNKDCYETTHLTYFAMGNGALPIIASIAVVVVGLISAAFNRI